MAQLVGMINNLRDGIKTSDIFGKKKLAEMQTEFDAISHELDKVLETVVKPDFRFYGREIGVQPLMLPIRVQDICNIALYNSVLRTVIINIKNEIFRQPPVWRPRFVLKCNDCHKEYQRSVNSCDKCGSVSFREPDIDQTNIFESLILDANKNKQSMRSVFKQIEEDFNIVDDGYLILVKDYIVDGHGIEYQKVVEMIRGDPEIMRIVANEKGEIGNKWWVCPYHRHPVSEANENENERRLGRIYESPGVCEVCGRKLYEVHHVAINGGEAGLAPSQYYIEGEVIHASKYSPSLLYGYSPVVSVWKESSTLLNMANYVNEYYKYMRIPKGIITTNTMNPESMYKKWDEINERMRLDPQYIPMIATQGDSSSKNDMKFVRFIDTLTEMGYIEGKDELRQRISALFGVSNIILNDSTASGGLNNEGLQIKVTDRAVEVGQQVWNDEVYPELMKQFYITDWSLVLLPNEESDKMKRIQTKTSEAQYAQIMQQMGFKVEMDPDGGFSYSGEAIDMSQQQEEMAAAEGSDEGIIPGEDVPEESVAGEELEAEGGKYFDMFFDSENKGSIGEEISDALNKIMPWKRSMAQGYRKKEIIRRDGRRQIVWVKAASEEETGKKRGSTSGQMATESKVQRSKLDIQRRSGTGESGAGSIKREGYKSKWEGEKDPGEKPTTKEKQISINKFEFANKDVVVNLVSTETAELEGHKAGYNKEEKKLYVDENVSDKELQSIFKKYHDVINNTNEENEDARKSSSASEEVEEREGRNRVEKDRK